jgi:hypothetical protein
VLKKKGTIWDLFLLCPVGVPNCQEESEILRKASFSALLNHVPVDVPVA